MRKWILIALIVLVACTPKVIVKSGKPSLDPVADKARCVIFNIDGNSDAFIPVYLDGKIIGGIKDKCMTAFDVVPGEHYLTATQDNETTMKLGFKAGRNYYIRMGSMETPIMDAVNMKLISDLEAKEYVNSGLDFKVLNPDRQFDNMDDDDFQEEIQEYREWADENPKDAKLESEYEGY